MGQRGIQKKIDAFFVEMHFLIDLIEGFYGISGRKLQLVSINL